jgi:hypothetical protein
MPASMKRAMLALAVSAPNGAIAKRFTQRRRKTFVDNYLAPKLGRTLALPRSTKIGGKIALLRYATKWQEIQAAN